MSGITVSSVTMMGQKHRNRGVPCEDSSLAVQRDGVSCVVVCDGAGSKQYTHARFGSKSACKTVSDLLIDHFDALYQENREAAVRAMIIAAIHIGFANLMEQYKLDTLERLSCTLLFCAVKDRRMIIGHLGDGLIAGVTSSGVHPVTMPQNEKDGTTFFVTVPHAADYLRIVKTTVDDYHGIALMTDGVQDSVYDEASGLVKPVVARMVESASKGREHSEGEIRAILEKYIVGASNNSDDASFGIMLFDGTKAPDTESLPKEAPSFPRSQETFRDLQEKMLPQVKKAKQVFEDCKSNPPAEPVPVGEELQEENKLNPVPAPVISSFENEPVKNKEPEIRKSEVKEERNEASGAGNMLWLKIVALIELIAIIVLLLKIFILKG